MIYYIAGLSLTRTAYIWCSKPHHIYAGISKWSQRGGLENRLPKRHGGSNPSSCANKNGLLLAGRPIFIATVRGDEPEGFAYRRHRANFEEQTLRGICVARRCRIEFYTEAERLELTLPRAAYPSSKPAKQIGFCHL